MLAILLIRGYVQELHNSFLHHVLDKTDWEPCKDLMPYNMLYLSNIFDVIFLDHFTSHNPYIYETYFH